MLTSSWWEMKPQSTSGSCWKSFDHFVTFRHTSTRRCLQNNPMQGCWRIAKQSLRRRDRRPTRADGLWAKFRALGRDTTVQSVDGMVAGMAPKGSLEGLRDARHGGEQLEGCEWSHCTLSRRYSYIYARCSRKRLQKVARVVEKKGCNLVPSSRLLTSSSSMSTYEQEQRYASTSMLYAS